ncbi:hypothetical protein PORY_001084 [Pneumocystis oryctolagi]|uniref:Uncharacterized protein n=1 Tax=Pneumocystis oryctolagi TaxID=42067 RepID=A0ACB7CF06_9ASCO|nr:hypothetical protein PORY_001084 [Pneumocystis oryctolagi]
MNDFIDRDDNEPYLKYTRFSGVASEIFSKDFISTFEVLSDILVLGSHNGYLYIIDMNNDKLSQHHIHSASISDLSIDETGEYIATASIDGCVALCARSSSNIILYNYRRPVKSVAIDPNYTQNPRIISGWLGNKDIVLHYGEGPIYEIQWHENLIAWANDMGVKIYSTVFSQRISFIEKIPDSPRSDLFQCRLFWSSSNTLLIGWANNITVVTIKSPDFNHRLPYSEISIKLDCIVSGIAKFEDKYLVLAFISDINSLMDTEISTRPIVERPELRLINSKNEEISGDALNLLGYSKFQANDFNLRLCPKKKYIYIMGPNDGVIARERELKDHLLWLIKHEYYEKAITIVEKLQEPIDEYLAKKGEYDKISSMSQNVFENDADLWEKWIFNFAESGHLHSITPYIPVNNPRLKSFIYEMVISYYLVSNQELLLHILKNWPCDIYNIDSIISAVRDMWERSPKDALHFYLRLKSPKTIDLIKQYRLFDSIQNDIFLLFELNTFSEAECFSEKILNDKIIHFLVEYSHLIPVHKVIHQLEGYHIFQYRYLRAIFIYDNHLASDFGDLQVELYAEYDRPILMEFLRTSYTYSLEKAYKICELRNYISEQIFILGRIGDNKKALTLIIEKLNDIDQAIEFAKNQTDEDLWEDLIIYSLDKPIFICRLLENAGSIINPIKLIKRIPKGLEIPYFRESLLKILKEYELQMTLISSAYKISSMEVSNLYENFLQNQKRGILIDVKLQKCRIVIFFCKHLYHINCILKENEQTVSAIKVYKNASISIGIKNTTASIIKDYLKDCPLCYK